jgi:hypothetical protein
MFINVGRNFFTVRAALLRTRNEACSRRDGECLPPGGQAKSQASQKPATKGQAQDKTVAQVVAQFQQKSFEVGRGQKCGIDSWGVAPGTR